MSVEGIETWNFVKKIVKDDLPQPEKVGRIQEFYLSNLKEESLYNNCKNISYKMFGLYLSRFNLFS
jgi:hypothetical protein